MFALVMAEWAATCAADSREQCSCLRANSRENHDSERVPFLHVCSPSNKISLNRVAGYRVKWNFSGWRLLFCILSDSNVRSIKTQIASAEIVCFPDLFHRFTAWLRPSRNFESWLICCSTVRRCR